MDITRASDVSRAIGACQPWAVINATGFVDVDRAELDACMAVQWGEDGGRSLCTSWRRPGGLLLGVDERTFTGRVMSAGHGERIMTTSEVISPTYVPALADSMFDLLVDGERGVWHLANHGALSWTALARRIVSEMGLETDLVEEVAPEELGRVAVRPRYSVLGSERGSPMPTLDDSLTRLLRERERVLAHYS